MWAVFNHQDSGTVPRGKKAVPEYHQKYDDGSGPLTPRVESRTGPRTPRQGIDAVPGIRVVDGERMGLHTSSAAKDSVRFFSSTRSLGPSGLSTPRTESRAPYEWDETPRRAVSTDSVTKAADRTFSTTPRTRDMFRFEAEAKPQKQKAEFSKGEGLTTSTNSLSRTHRFDGVGAFGPDSRDGPGAQRSTNPLAWTPASPNPQRGKARVCKINLYKNPADQNPRCILNKEPVRQEPETPHALRPPLSPRSAPRSTPCSEPVAVHVEQTNGVHTSLRNVEHAVLTNDTSRHINGTATSRGVPLCANGFTASTPSTIPSHDKSVPKTCSANRPVTHTIAGDTTPSGTSREAESAIVRARSEDWYAAEQQRAVEMNHLRHNWQHEFRLEKRPCLKASEVVCLASPRRMPCRKFVPGYHVNQLTNAATDPVDSVRPTARKVVPGQHVSQVSCENQVERSSSLSSDRLPLSALPGLRQWADNSSLPGTPRVRTRHFEPPTESVLKKSSNPLDAAINRFERIGTRTTATQPQPSASYVNMLARRECGLKFSKANQFRATSTTPKENPRSSWNNARCKMRHSIS